MERERVEFGGQLKEERLARSLSVAELARLTKIPPRSLEMLEAGRWSELPAEVFVRGFLKSYARAVGMDPDDTVRRYGELVHGTPAAAAPVPAEPSVLVPTRARPATVKAAAESKPGESAPAEAVDDPSAAIRSFSRAILDAGRETRRMPLTLAVIILVIVATLTMSLLLDPPGQSSGGGVTQVKTDHAEAARS
jgi:transcriptional regulator with XRE-family HTH domain